MESYDDFCSRRLLTLQTDPQAESTKQANHREALSTIEFHGKPVLLPVLNEVQRAEMTEFGKCAAQRSHVRQQRQQLLARIQHILSSVQLQRGQNESELSPEGPSPPQPPHMAEDSGVRDCLSISSVSSSSSRALRTETLRQLNRRLGRRLEPSEQTWAGPDLDSSRSSMVSLNVDEEQRGRTLSPNNRDCVENLSDKENDNAGLGTEVVGRLGSSVQAERRWWRRSVSPDFLQGRLSLSLTGSYARLPSPLPSRSPRRRPVAPGNILISVPVSEEELSPESVGRVGDSRPRRHWDSLEHSVPTVAEPLSETPLSPPDGAGWYCDLSELQNQAFTSASTSTPYGSDSFTPRTTLSMNSKVPPNQSDRGSKGCPTPRSPSILHSPPAPLNRSYDVESPSPTLQRPRISGPRVPPSEQGEQGAKVKCQFEDAQSGSPNGKVTLGQLASPRHLSVAVVQREIGALEEMCVCLEREHSRQLTQLLAEQERQQQRLLQDLQGGPKGQGGQDKHAVCESRNEAGSSTLKQCGTSLPHKVSLDVHSIEQTTAWSKTTPSKTSSRQYQVLSSQQQQALCRLSAVARGYLTRRLLNTSKVKNLRKIVQDTREFMCSLQTDSQKRACPQDLSLQQRVVTQLQAVRSAVYEIFFVWTMKARLALLQQDREAHNERRLRETEKAKSPRDKLRLSSATQKSLNRRKNKQGKKTQHKPKSPPTCRILQPSQGLNSSSSTPPSRERGLVWQKEECMRRLVALRGQLSVV